MSNIAPLVDSNNVTLEWPRPEGRVETYIVRWWDEEHPNDIFKRNVSQNQNETGSVRLLIGDLMPGVLYVFSIQSISNDLDSDITFLKSRTSKLLPTKRRKPVINHFIVISAAYTIGSCGRQQPAEYGLD